MTQARKSWKALIDIRDGRIREEQVSLSGETYAVVASVKDVLTATVKIMAYAVGEPTKSVELTGTAGGPIEISWVE